MGLSEKLKQRITTHTHTHTHTHTRRLVKIKRGYPRESTGQPLQRAEQTQSDPQSN